MVSTALKDSLKVRLSECICNVNNEDYIKLDEYINMLTENAVLDCVIGCICLKIGNMEIDESDLLKYMHGDYKTVENHLENGKYIIKKSI